MIVQNSFTLPLYLIFENQHTIIGKQTTLLRQTDQLSATEIYVSLALMVHFPQHHCVSIASRVKIESLYSNAKIPRV